MKKLAIATALFTTTLFTSHLYAYQTEGDANYEHGHGHGEHEDIYAVGGTYYLNPVQVKSGTPLAEAAFLAKASNIGLNYTHNVTKDDPYNIEVTADVIAVGGEFFIPNTQFYVSAALARAEVELELPNARKVKDKENSYGIELGYMPITDLLVAVGVSDSTHQVSNEVVGDALHAEGTNVEDGSEDDTIVSVRAKYVTTIGPFYTNFEAMIIHSDETAYGAQANLYLDPSLSLGASFSNSTVSGSDPVFGLHAEKFVTPQIVVGAHFTTTDHHDCFGISGKFRF